MRLWHWMNHRTRNSYRRHRNLEARLLDGPLHLALGRNLAITVDIHNGLTLHTLDARPLGDHEGRQMLHAARMAVALAEDPNRHPGKVVWHPGDRHYAAELTPQENAFVGDVMAAYFRLTDDSDTTRP